MEPVGIVTFPLIVVLAFAAMACGLAVLRAVAENRESNRTVQLISRRGPRQDAAVIQIRRAADTLHRGR